VYKASWDFLGKFKMQVSRKQIEDDESLEAIPGWNAPPEDADASQPLPSKPEGTQKGQDTSDGPPLHQEKRTTNNDDVCCPGIEDLFETQFFKALSDPNRVAILVELARKGRPCTVTELSACCPRDLSVVSRHLTALRDAGVVKSERRGKQVYYWVRVSDVADRMRGIVVSLTDLAGRYRTLGDESVEQGEDAGKNRE